MIDRWDSVVPAVQVQQQNVSLVVRCLVAVVSFYRMAISPLRTPSCRYLPTCSEYAVDALQTWGPARGGWLALRRLLRCHPWHAGGHDPVPSRSRPRSGTTVNDPAGDPASVAPHRAAA